MTASEWALADPAAWAYLRPILRENGGWAVFISTVRGRNHLHRMFEGAKNDPGWFVQRLTATETGVMTEKELEQERLEYQREYGHEDGDALFAQEYMCTDILPHDAEARELQTNRSRRQTLEALNRKVRIADRQDMRFVADGINAVRTILPRCWFDEKKCAKGVDALSQYRREWDDVRKTYHDRPYHDWSSHGADAFRYLAIALDALQPMDIAGIAAFRRARGYDLTDAQRAALRGRGR